MPRCVNCNGATRSPGRTMKDLTVWCQACTKLHDQINEQRLSVEMLLEKYRVSCSEPTRVGEARVVSRFNERTVEIETPAGAVLSAKEIDEANAAVKERRRLLDKLTWTQTQLALAEERLQLRVERRMHKKQPEAEMEA